jgi:PPK2 family polyphosphate:nucleotide phosphotransferase
MNLERYRARKGDRSILNRIHPDEHGGLEKPEAEERLAKGLARLGEQQGLLYAQDQISLLLIFQGLDASGKDGAIKHVMSGVNPQGTEVHAFKVPSNEELGHNYLWRAAKVLPSRGRIGIFNRSYYEEVLVVRVHPRVLDRERLPSWCKGRQIWSHRFEDINGFEKHLFRNGTIVRKFFLHVSRREQKKRLLARLDDPAKNWKFQEGDLDERAMWPAYMRAYRDVLADTSTEHAPWYVVPADHKWFAHALIADVIVQTLDDLDLSFPKLSREDRKALKQARRRLQP